MHAKKKAGEPEQQDEVIEYKSEPQATDETELSDKAIVTNLTRIRIF